MIPPHLWYKAGLFNYPNQLSYREVTFFIVACLFSFILKFMEDILSGQHGPPAQSPVEGHQLPGIDVVITQSLSMVEIIAQGMQW